MLLSPGLKVGVLVMTFRLRQARSLKDKRSIVSRIRERTRSRFNLSVAEIDGQDDLRRLVVGFSIVGTNARDLQSTLDKVSNYVDGLFLAEVVSSNVVVDAFGRP